MSISSTKWSASGLQSFRLRSNGFTNSLAVRGSPETCLSTLQKTSLIACGRQPDDPLIHDVRQRGLRNRRHREQFRRIGQMKASANALIFEIAGRWQTTVPETAPGSNLVNSFELTLNETQTPGFIGIISKERTKLSESVLRAPDAGIPGTGFIMYRRTLFISAG